MLFIAQEQRACFLDNLDAMMWERRNEDFEKAVSLWQFTFASKLDPVKEKFK